MMGSRRESGFVVQDSGAAFRLRSARQVFLFVCVCLALATSLGAGDSLAERRHRLEGMSAAQKEDLLRHRDQLHALDPDEQQSIRRLHERLESEPDGEKLREIMNRYCRWLETLQAYQRSELSDLGPAERIEEIKQIKQEQVRSAGRLLSGSDQESLVGWIDRTYSVAHEAPILDLLPGHRRQQYAKNPSMRHRVAIWLLCQRWSLGAPALQPPPTERELAELRAALSPEVRSRLEPKPAADQIQMIAAWLPRVARQYDLMADFFEFVLSDEERDPLLSMPSGEMQRQLREKYQRCVSQLRLPEARPRRPAPGKKPAPPSGEKSQPKKTEKDAKIGKTSKKERPSENKR